MVLYDYRCPQCGKAVEVNLTMAQAGKVGVACPTCGCDMSRVYQAPPVHFGSGFPGNDMKKRRQYAKEQDANEKAHKVQNPQELRRSLRG
jgi:putative FmdB family regulatory protein